MKFLEYLYFKYYRFQCRVENGSIAPLMAFLMIPFICMVYWFAFAFIASFMFPDDAEAFNLIVNHRNTLLGLLILTIILYLALIRNGKSDRIISDPPYQNKSSLVAILFPAIGFALLFTAMCFKALQNQGKI